MLMKPRMRYAFCISILLSLIIGALIKVISYSRSHTCVGYTHATCTHIKYTYVNTNVQTYTHKYRYIYTYIHSYTHRYSFIHSFILAVCDYILIYSSVGYIMTQVLFLLL